MEMYLYWIWFGIGFFVFAGLGAFARIVRDEDGPATLVGMLVVLAILLPPAGSPALGYRILFDINLCAALSGLIFGAYAMDLAFECANKKIQRQSRRKEESL